MSRLFYHDRGRMLYTHNEELTSWRWARKRFALPAAAANAPADLWIAAMPYHANSRGGPPLEVRVNGRLCAKLTPLPAGSAWRWYHVPLPRLGARRVDVELRANSPAMNAWMLGLDPSLPPRDSDLSLDRGKTWQHQSMGAHQAFRGEYLIRLRSHAPALGEQRLPKIVYQDPRHPRMRELLALLPAPVRNQRDPWKQTLALRSWITRQWTHDPFGQAYAPWDAATILDWIKRTHMHGQKGKISFCVHFGVVMMTLAAALGHRSRCIGVTEDVNSVNGHFLAEVHDPGLGKWVLHDANYDMHYRDPNTLIPLSAREMADRVLAGQSLLPGVVRGPSFIRGPQRLLRAFRQVFGPGHSYRNIGVWSRNDLISDPTAAPPNHGHVVYAEPDWIWYSPKPHDLAPMFPHRTGDAAVFDRA